MKHEIQAGDIMENQWGDKRVVWQMIDEDCYYIDYGGVGSVVSGYFYNPCRACVSATAMRKYRKVGELPYSILIGLQRDIRQVAQMHNEVFAKADDMFNRNDAYDIARYLFEKKTLTDILP